MSAWRWLLVAGAFAVAAPLRAGIPALPTEQWRWGAGLPGNDRWPDSTVLVVQLTDDNSDGLIDLLDSPDVAFLHYDQSNSCDAAVTALDGATGAELFTTSSELPQFGSAALGGATGYIVAGDIDDDGTVEILVSDYDQVMVLSHEGALERTIRWPRPPQGCVWGAYMRPAHLGLADLDQDGVPEVLQYATVVSTGAVPGLAWSAPVSNPSWTSFSHALDIDPASPGLELLAGRTLYSAQGSVLWTRADLEEGSSAAGDVDGDGDPEIILAWDTLNLVDHRGSSLGPPVDRGTLGFPSAPVMADIDGDGRDEIVVQSGTRIAAYDADAGLSLKWTSTISDGSCCAGAMAYDFDGDGASEIVHRDEHVWRILEGATGAELSAIPFQSLTGEEFPTVANIDRDCAAEIAVVGIGEWGAPSPSNKVIAYEIAGAVTPRSIFNQHAYHVTNVEDDGRIPQFEVTPWSLGVGALEQVSGPCSDCVSSGVPPGVGAVLRLRHQGDSVTLSWDRARLLAPSEHFHVLGALSSPTARFRNIAPEGFVDREITMPPNPALLQFFDVRISDPCEYLSIDEYPPGWDRPGGDSDADGVINASDNCEVIANSDQSDADGDTLGDACDPNSN